MTQSCHSAPLNYLLQNTKKQPFELENSYISTNTNSFLGSFVLECATSYYIKVKTMGTTSIRFSDDVEKPLESLSKQLDRSKSYIINQAVKEYLARRSLDKSRWQDTLEALKSLESGNAIEESDVDAWLNSWGTKTRTPPPQS